MGKYFNTKGKPSKNRKDRDMKAFEDQVIDIMKTTDIPDIKNIGLSKEAQKRLSEADTSELDNIEKELGISIEETVGEIESDVIGTSQNFNESIDIEDETVEKVDIDVQGEVTGYSKQDVEKVDGKFKINISDDKMSVSLDFFPSKGGGKPLTLEQVKSELNNMNVVYGVNYDLIMRLIGDVEQTKEEKSGVIIAQGTLPEDGKDGSIEFHFSDNDDILRFKEESDT